MREPAYYDGSDCDHADYYIDGLGMWRCESCSYKRAATLTECDAWDRRQIEMEMAWAREHARANPFRRFWLWMKAKIVHILRDEEEDEIPF